MNGNDFLEKLKGMGVSQTQVAEILGVTRQTVWKKSVRYTEKICMFVYIPSQCIMFQLFALSCQLSEQQTSTKTQQQGGISAPSNNDYRGDTPLVQR